MEASVSQGTRVPGLGKTIIDPDQMLDLIDHMRISIPKEVQESRRILEERDQVLNEARSESQTMVSEARHEIETRLQGSDVVRLAQQRADEVISNAQQQAEAILRESSQRASDQRREVDEYVVQVLR